MLSLDSGDSILHEEPYGILSENLWTALHRKKFSVKSSERHLVTFWRFLFCRQINFLITSGCYKYHANIFVDIAHEKYQVTNEQTGKIVLDKHTHKLF